MTDARYNLTWKIRRLFKLMAEMSDGYLAPHGISVQERAVVEHLYNWGSVSVPDMARIFYMTRQNMQVRVNSLLKKGWAAKKTNPAHERSALISLTARGRSGFATIKTHEETVINSLFETISAGEVQAANTTLRKLTDAILAELNTQQKDTPHDITAGQ